MPQPDLEAILKVTEERGHRVCCGTNEPTSMGQEGTITATAGRTVHQNLSIGYQGLQAHEAFGADARRPPARLV